MRIRKPSPWLPPLQPSLPSFFLSISLALANP
jgi:hypothetical protein